MPLKCPQCGADVAAPPGSLHAKCGYCGATVSAPAAPSPYTPGPSPFVGPPGAPPPQAFGPIHPMFVTGPAGDIARLSRGPAWMLIIPLVVLLAIGGVIFYFVREATSSVSSSFGGRTWTGAAPLVCAGNDHITALNLTATFTDTAISASGNCHLECRNCAVKAAYGIETSGNAHVFFEGGSLEGTSAAAVAGGNSQIDLRGTRVVGSVSRSGNGRVRR
jgi:hypothetical protein